MLEGWVVADLLREYRWLLVSDMDNSYGDVPISGKYMALVPTCSFSTRCLHVHGIDIILADKHHETQTHGWPKVFFQEKAW